MQLYIDKYLPRELDQIPFNKEAIQTLKSFSADSFPHLLLIGRRGSYKRIAALLLLRQIFEATEPLTLKKQTLTIDLPNKKPIEVKMLVSPYHFQFNPSVYGVHDRTCLQEFIERVVKYRILTKHSYRVVIIEDADLLTHEAQQSLRRTMETSIGGCRFIFLSNMEGHLIDPICSRCVQVRMASPTHEEIMEQLQKVCHEEHLVRTPEELTQIANYSERNMQKALNTLQKSVVYQIFKEDDIDQVIDQIVKLLVTGSNLSLMVKELRKHLNDLLVNNISAQQILNLLFKKVVYRMPASKPEALHRIIEYASQFDNSLRLGGKAVYHLEGFCLNVFHEMKQIMLARRDGK